MQRGSQQQSGRPCGGRVGCAVMGGRKVRSTGRLVWRCKAATLVVVQYPITRLSSTPPQHSRSS